MNTRFNALRLIGAGPPPLGAVGNKYGEALDFCRVVGYDHDRGLALRAEMKLPGEALLEFRVEPRGARHCTMRQVARIQPRGLFGPLYWYVLAPLHYVVFRGMLRGIQREAIQIASRGADAASDIGGARSA